MTERSWLGWDVSEAVQLWNIIATDLPLGVIGTGGSVEMVGQEAVGEREARGDTYLTLCGQFPLLWQPRCGSEQAGGQGRIWLPILSASFMGAGADRMVSLLYL